MDLTAQDYIERLKQAVRVMQGLSEADRANFDLRVIAVRTASGLRACIAGHCGLDPWFQARGFSTIVDEDESGLVGDLTVHFGAFFGTCTPFLRTRYGREFVLDEHRKVTVEDAINVLRHSIDCFKMIRSEPAD